MKQSIEVNIVPAGDFEWRKDKAVIAQQTRELVESYIKESEQVGIKKTLTDLSKEFELTDRGLRSILNEGKIPQVKTALKMYKAITKIDSDFEVINFIPNPTKDWILDSKLFKSLINTTLISDELTIEYENNKVFALVYDLSVDSGITENEVVTRFGPYGVSQLRKLVSTGVLKKEKDLFIRSGKNIFRTNIAEKNRLLNLCEQFVDPNDFKTLDSNVLRTTCYDLSPDQYQNWIYEIEQCFKKLNDIGDSFTDMEKTIKASAGLFSSVMVERGNNEIH